MSNGTTKELTDKLADLADSIVTDPQRLNDFVKQWCNGFHNYSFGNYILATFQRPGFTLLAGFNTWKKKKRFVKKGEKAIKILAPLIKKGKDEVSGEEFVHLFGYKNVSVFDYAQTDGEEIELGCPHLIPDTAKVTVQEVAKVAPVPVEFVGPQISNGYTDGKKIVLAQDVNNSSSIATLTHEWAHVLLHFDKKAQRITTATAELEAESVSYIVCAFLGIDNEKAKLYLGNWKASKQSVDKQGTRILKCAEKIVRKLIDSQIITSN